MFESWQNIDNKKVNILQKFTSNVWLLEQIFWEKWFALYDMEKEKTKNILESVYWISDVYDVFWPELDEGKVWKILSTMFRYTDNSGEVVEPSDDLVL